ncbi:adenylate/guanylate cyclase domain-containing protein [Alkalinema pantanalense CENA528]|uniref:adenylate/guanylate cyclase domain-containing protein n=1 Tax=Alkalinema pantanalense TaxID=1620705 RepID=UPI003D6E67E7
MQPSTLPASVPATVLTPSRGLTRLYVLSLTAIATLAIVGQVLIQKQLDRQSTDLKIIQTAQNRQTLCQQLLKNAIAIPLLRDPDRRQERIRELQQVLSQWQTSKDVLRQDLQSMVSPADFAEVEAMLKKLDPSSQAMVEAAQMIVSTFQARSNATPSAPRDRLQAPKRLLPSAVMANPEELVAGPRLLQAEQEFTRINSEIIHWYSHKAKDGVAHLKLLEFGLLGVTLVVLVLEGVLIFRPAVRKLEEAMTALQKALQQVTQEQEKSEKLLLNILPEPIADRLKRKPQAIADGFSEATVLFADIVGFTELSSRLSPHELVAQLNEIFSQFDRLAEQYGLEKIKTIGDAYMVVGGLPEPRKDHAAAIAEMAIAMQTTLATINQNRGESLNIRVGINSGPVVAGVIGLKKFIYDLWGDTVNVASRMESHGKPGSIHVSETTYHMLQHLYEFEERGVIPIKGKGEMRTYWLKGKANMIVASNKH